VIAKLLHPGSKYESSGFILTTVLGIVGAFVATYLGQAAVGTRLAKALVSLVQSLARNHHPGSLGSDRTSYSEKLSLVQSIYECQPSA
jgi:hypothetical protein